MKITVTTEDGTVFQGELAQVQKQSDAVEASGPEMTTPLVGYPFFAGVTTFPMPVEAGRVYTLEAVPNGEGYGSGAITVTRGDGGVVSQAIVNGVASAFPVQATATEALAVKVECSAPGLIRYTTV